MNGSALGKAAGFAFMGIGALAFAGSALADGPSQGPVVDEVSGYAGNDWYFARCAPDANDMTRSATNVVLLVPPDQRGRVVQDVEADLEDRLFATDVQVADHPYGPINVRVSGEQNLDCGIVLASAMPDTYSITAKSSHTSAQLTAAEVAANTEQLRQLLFRSDVETPGTDRPTILTYTFANACGDFMGQAHIGKFNRDGTNSVEYDRQLVFSTNPDEPEILLNPDRIPLSSVSFTRNRLNSHRVPAWNQYEINLYVNPTLTDDPPAAGLLYLDNVDPNGSSSSAKPGRGLNGIVDSVHCKHGGQDVQLYQLFMRQLETTVADDLALPNLRYDTGMILYKGTEPDMYHAEIYYQDISGQWVEDQVLRVDLRMEYDNPNIANPVLHFETDLQGSDLRKEAAFIVTPGAFLEEWRAGDGYGAINYGTGNDFPSSLLDFGDTVGDTWLNWLMNDD